MGPNGSGKSTLAYVLAGKTDYQLTAGEVLFDGEDLHQPDERAARGVFLAFPVPARYGVTPTCRASFALYNTKDEVDTLAESMVKAREFFA